MKKGIIFLNLLFVVFLLGVAFFSVKQTSSIHYVYEEIELPKEVVVPISSEVSVTFSGNKRIEGIEETDGIFTFALYETDQDYAVDDLENPLLTSATSSKIIKSAPYSFDSIVYREEGVHYYVIHELKNTSSFITDKKEYKMRVSVLRIGSDLAVEVTGDAPNNQIDFSSRFREETKENPYTRNPFWMIFLGIIGIVMITIIIEIGIRFRKLKTKPFLNQDDILKNYEE